MTADEREMPESEKAWVEVATTELMRASQSGFAPRGAGASSVWFRGCSDYFLHAVMESDTAALLAYTALRAWVERKRELQLSEDDLTDGIDCMRARASIEWGRRAGVLEIVDDPGGEVWDVRGALALKWLYGPPKSGESMDDYESRAMAWAKKKAATRLKRLEKAPWL